jgi:hypothetical protein
MDNYSHSCKYKNLILPYRIIVEPTNFDCNHNLIIILINSKVDQDNVRKSIRLQWSSQRHNNIRLLFVVGYNENVDRIEIESRIFNDILSTSIVENYLNLTHKMYSAFDWLSTKCSLSKLIFKLDADVIVNVNAFVDYCQQLIESNSYHLQIYGYVKRYAKPYRDKSNKWYMSI